MTVPELLATHSSLELAEWRAHFAVNGFLDPGLFDVLAQIHEQLQLTNHLLGGAHFTEEDGENPIPAPVRLRSPGALPVDDDKEG